ncbi:tetratricopeptide repeat protein [Methylocella silvestris]|nr:tetratricopeptide repeat protein [Methylocella silvestris]
MAAEDGAPFRQQWPGGLPDGWRVLGDDEPTPGGPSVDRPGAFDFRRDGATLSPQGRPFGGGAGGLPSGGAARPHDPAKDEAALKAAKEKARAEELKKALAPKPEPAVLRQRTLDDLFKRLGVAAEPQEAQLYAAAIQRIWMQTPSDTAALIMQRAMASVEAKNYTQALTLLDRLVAIAPAWAEAWNERATVRFMSEDADGAMADIDKVLRLEPRHFGALMGMGVILQRAGLDKRALEAFEKALAVYPAQPGLKESVEKLSLDVNGRDI